MEDKWIKVYEDNNDECPMRLMAFRDLIRELAFSMGMKLDAFRIIQVAGPGNSRGWLRLEMNDYHTNHEPNGFWSPPIKELAEFCWPFTLGHVYGNKDYNVESVVNQTEWFGTAYKFVERDNKSFDDRQDQCWSWKPEAQVGVQNDNAN